MDGPRNNRLDNRFELKPASRRVLDFIDSTFGQIFSEIQRRPFGTPHITIQRIKSFDVSFNHEKQKLVWNITGRSVAYGWPGKSRDEAWRFACVGRILFEIHTAIVSNLTVTKRDIYYRDPSLFKTQEVVDRYVDNIAYTCNVTRADLKVTASPRGLFVGLVADNDITQAILEVAWDAATMVDHIRWILVVEKEATFKQLVERKLHRRCSAGSGVIVTGRGYPDLATRKFLQTLAQQMDRPCPVYGLFDADPDGLAILSCYQYGSQSMAQEHANTLPNIIYLGMRLCDIEDDALISLTKHDRAKAMIMLSKPEYLKDNPFNHGYCTMLQRMLMLNVKAEIQGFECGSRDLVDWLEEQLNRQNSL